MAIDGGIVMVVVEIYLAGTIDGLSVCYIRPQILIRSHQESILILMIPSALSELI